MEPMQLVAQLEAGDWHDSHRPVSYTHLDVYKRQVYIGQTGRSFEKRMYGHNYSFRYNDGKSNYANHLLEKDHSYNDNFEILHLSGKGPKLDLLETLEINKHKYVVDASVL